MHQVDIAGCKIDLSGSHGQARQMSLKAEESLTLFKSIWITEQFKLSSACRLQMQSVEIRSNQGTIEADTSYLDQTALNITSGLTLRNRSSSKVSRSRLTTDQLDIIAGELQLTKTEISALSNMALSAKAIEGRDVLLMLERGDARWNIDEANLDTLVASIGGSFYLKSDSFNLINSQLHSQGLIDISSKIRCVITQSLLQGKNVEAETPCLILEQSMLRAKGFMQLGQRHCKDKSVTLALKWLVGKPISSISARKSQLEANDLSLSSDKIDLSESFLAASDHLALYGMGLRSHRAMLCGKTVKLTGGAIIALKTNISGGRGITLSAPLQVLYKSSLQAKGLIWLRGLVCVGLQNNIHSHFLVQSIGLFNMSLKNNRQIELGSLDLSLVQLKWGDQESAGLICEVAPLALTKYQTSQRAIALTSFAGHLNLTEAQIDAKMIHAHSLWHLQAQNMQLRAEFYGAIGSSGTMNLERANVQGGELHFEASSGNLRAGISQWKVHHLELSSPTEIDLRAAALQSHELIGRAPIIDQQGAHVSAETALLVADQAIDQRSATLQGGLQMRAPQVRHQKTAFVSIGSSAVTTEDLQTDDETIFAGSGGIELTFQNPQLKGQLFSKGLLAINAQNPDFISDVQGACDVLQIKASGTMRNLKPLISRIGKIEVAKELQNEWLISGLEKMKVRTLRYEEGEKGELSAPDLYLHQQEAISTSKLGNVKGGHSTELSSDGGVFVDKEDTYGGALKLICPSKEFDARISSSITVHGPTHLEGRSVSAHGLRTLGLTLRSDDQVETHNLTTLDGIDVEGNMWNITGDCHVRGAFKSSVGKTNLGVERIDHLIKGNLQIVGSADIEGEVFKNFASSLQIAGPTSLKLEEFLNESRYCHAELLNQNWSGAIAVDQAESLFQGDLNAKIGGSAINTGGLVSVSGNSNFTAQKLENMNLSHSYQVEECVGKEIRKTCGFKRRTKFLHEWRHYNITDHSALFDTQGLCRLQIAESLTNSGVMRIGQLVGKVGGLSLGQSNLVGKASAGVEERTGSPLGTIFIAKDAQLDVVNHSNIWGRLQSGGNLHFTTGSLELYRKGHEEKVPFTSKRGWGGSDRTRWKVTRSHDAGGELLCGGDNLVKADEKVRADLATIQIAGDFQYDAKQTELDTGQELTREDLPGKSSIFRSRDIHTLKTTFHPTRIHVGGQIDMKTEGLFRNRGSEIIAGKRGVIRSGTLVEEVPMALNCALQTRGFTHLADRHEGVSSVPKVMASEGNIVMRTDGRADYAGLKEAKDQVKLISGGPSTFNTFSQVLQQRDSKTRCDGLSISNQTVECETLDAVAPAVRAKHIYVKSGESITAKGAQFEAQETIVLNTPILDWGPHEYELLSKSSGWEYGLSFPGSRPMKSLLKDQSLKKLTQELIKSDPLIAKTHQLLKAQDGEEVALSTLMVAVEGFKASNTLSLARQEGQIGRAVGQHMGLLNDKGALSLRITFYAQQFSQSTTVRDALPGLLSAGKSITILSNDQTFTGSDLQAKEISILGQDGLKGKEKAKVTFRSSTRDIAQDHESDGISIAIDPSGAVMPGFNTSEGASSSKTHRNTNMQAEKINWNASSVNLFGANVHSDEHVGSIDEIFAKSQFNEEWARSKSYSADASGNVSFSSHELDSQKIDQSTFTANNGGATQLKVGKITAIGSAFHNIEAERIEGGDLVERHFEKRRNISLNIPEIAAFADHMAGSNVKEAKSIEGRVTRPRTSSPDPRRKKSVFNLGTIGTQTKRGEAVTRATVAGTSLPNSLNSDWKRRQDDLVLQTRNREFGIYGFDRRVLNLQIDQMLGRPERRQADILAIDLRLDHKQQDHQELEVTDELKKAQIKKTIAEDRESLQLQEELILVSSEGQLLEQGLSDSRKGLQFERLIDHEDEIVDHYQLYLDCQNSLDSASEKAMCFIRYDRQACSDDPHFINREMGINAADKLNAMSKMRLAKGAYWKSHVKMWETHAERATSPEEKKVAIGQINLYRAKMMQAYHQADTLISEHRAINKMLNLELDNYLIDQGLCKRGRLSPANEEQKQEIRRMLQPLDESSQLANKFKVRLSRSSTLTKEPNGASLEIYFQTNPEKFDQMQTMLENAGSEIAETRYRKVFGKKNSELQLEEKLMIAKNQVMETRLEDFSNETLTHIARQTGCTAQQVQAIARWRLNCYPDYFRAINEQHMAEEMIARSQPFDRSEILQRLGNRFNFGYGKSEDRDCWPVEDLKRYGVQFNYSIEQDLVPVTLTDRKNGIFHNDQVLFTDKEIELYGMTHWSKVTKSPVRLEKTFDEMSAPQSLLANGQTQEETRAMWLLGPKVLLTSCSGINTKLGESQADNLRWSKMAKLDLSVCIHNESFGTKYDVANVAFDGYRTLAAEAGLVRDTALTMKQTWMSYFEINPQGFVIHPCHSGGATHTLSALKEMPEELRNRVCVLAIAPQVMIGKQWCRHAIHVGTDRDEVFARAKKNNEEICSDVRVVDSTVIRDQDHTNRSATIQKELQSAFEDLKGRLNAQAH